MVGFGGDEADGFDEWAFGARVVRVEGHEVDGGFDSFFDAEVDVVRKWAFGGCHCLLRVGWVVLCCG